MLTSALLAALSFPLVHALYISPQASPDSRLDSRSPEPGLDFGKTSVQVTSPYSSTSTGKLIVGPEALYPVAHTSCYPAIGFQPPDEKDLPYDTSDWWCPADEEYAFVGFSYEVTACTFHTLHLC